MPNHQHSRKRAGEFEPAQAPGALTRRKRAHPMQTLPMSLGLARALLPLTPDPHSPSQPARRGRDLHPLGPHRRPPRALVPAPHLSPLLGGPLGCSLRGCRHERRRSEALSTDRSFAQWYALALPPPVRRLVALAACAPRLDPPTATTATWAHVYLVLWLVCATTLAARQVLGLYPRLLIETVVHVCGSWGGGGSASVAGEVRVVRVGLAPPWHGGMVRGPRRQLFCACLM